MKSTLLINPGPGEQLFWRTANETEPRCGAAAELAADPAVADADLVLVVPAQKVLLQSVSFAAHERRLLRQTVPYSLEEDLVEDVGDQHFALGAVADGQVPVAVVERQWLADWLARCNAAGLGIKRALPEQLLLPWRAGCWTLAPGEERWLVRVGPYRGFAFEPDSAALALQLLLDSANELPQKLLVCGDRAVADLLSQLPELLRGSVEALETPALQVPAAGEATLDLLQGTFARTLPWQRWLREWRIPAQALALALVAQLAVSALEHHQLEKKNVALRQQIEQVYRGVEPRGVVNNPELQLQRKVKALQGQGGAGAIPLLQQVGGALKSVPGINVQNLTYSERQGEIRLSLSASAFKDVEAVRTAIAGKGLDAQLVGSNADGDKTRAQLRITEHH